MVVEFLGFRGSVAKVSFPLRYSATSLETWFPTFWCNVMLSSSYPKRTETLGLQTLHSFYRHDLFHKNCL